MKKLIIILTGNFLLYLSSNGQYNRYLIQFKDKVGSPYSVSNPSVYLSQRAIDRRTRYGIPIEETDLPVNPAYIDSIRNVPNVTLLNRSKWLNILAIRTTDPAAIAKINTFPFVQSASTIAPKLSQPDNSVARGKSMGITESMNPADGSRLSNTTFNYGQTFPQVNIHNGQFLHDRGFSGQDMVIAVLDGGFSSYKSNPAFDSIRLNGKLLGEWNFVNNIQNTDQNSGHGMNCLSIIAANRPGLMVGTAPHASFWLFITEDVFSEYPIEELNWASGAEFADSVGADLISSSLGYQDFDNPFFDHLYPDRNGNVSMVTQAADLAAKKGMIVTNSAGNYGGVPDQRKYISCPADGDSVVAVGAVNTSGVIAGFSSWGPNSAGKIKPNVVSVGQGTIVANSLGDPVSGSGTSFANPNMAGLITSLWSAYPDFSNMEIINAVQQSADRYENPDERYGYGLPNMRKAFYLLKSERSRRLFGSNGWFRATPDPFTTQIDAAFIADGSGNVMLYLKKITGEKIDSVSFTTDSLDFKAHSFLNLDPLPAGYYYVQYKSATKDSTITLAKGEALFTNDWIRVFPNPFSEMLYLYFKARVSGTATISLYDMTGRLVSERAAIPIQKENIYYSEFPVIRKLSAGIYILRFDDGVNKKSIRLFRH